MDNHLYITDNLTMAAGCFNGKHPFRAIPVFYKVFEEGWEKNGNDMKVKEDQTSEVR